MSDKDKLLNEALEAIKSIKEARKNLDDYMLNLEKIVSKIEEDKFLQDHLTLNDIKVIQDIEKPKEEAKKKFKINFFIVLSLLTLLLASFNHYFFKNKVLVLNDYNVFLYEDLNMEPIIKYNSLVVSKENSSYSVNDYVVYDSHSKIKKVVNISNNDYLLESINYNFDSTSILNVNDINTKVIKNFNTLGNIISIFNDNYIYVYIFSGLSFIVGIFYYKKKDE